MPAESAAAGECGVVRRPSAADRGADTPPYRKEETVKGEEDQPEGGFVDSGDDGSPSLEREPKRAKALEEQVDEAALGEESRGRAAERPRRPAARLREAPMGAGVGPLEADRETQRETWDPRAR